MPRVDDQKTDAEFRRLVGERLEQARRRAEVTNAAELSQRLGWGPNQIGMWERGENVPGSDNLRALCAFYRVSADWVLGLGERPTLPKVGLMMDLELEQAVSAARTFEEVERVARRLGRWIDTGGQPYVIEPGVSIPADYEIVDEAEGEIRVAGITAKIRRLEKERGGRWNGETTG